MPLTVPVYEAQSVHKKMTTGRNGAFLVQCVDESQLDVGLYILKPSSKLLDNGGLQNELIAGLLAKKIGLPVPDLAIINVEPDFAANLRKTPFDEVGKSVGLNFGSQFLTGGYHTWPISNPLPNELEILGTEILAFDAFIQNPDRRNDNPNIFQNGKEIMLIDHDLAFSFTSLIGRLPSPWEEAAFKSCIVTQSHCHVFYPQMRGKALQLEPFEAKINAVTDRDFDEIMACVPTAWKTNKSQNILVHLKELRNNIEKFNLSLRRVMS